MKLAAFRTIVLDCDGVILDSNPVKTDAFFELASPEGEEAANRLVAFHREHGGVSRFEKLRHFREVILEKKPDAPALERCIERFGGLVEERLLTCPETIGLRVFLSSLPGGTKKIVASGGAESELRRVFARRGLATFFDAIYGSPSDKPTLLARAASEGHLALPALFVGDGRYDFEVADAAGLSFVFMHGYTEFEGWQQYFAARKILTVANLAELPAAFS